MSTQTVRHDIAKLESDINTMYDAIDALGSNRGEPNGAAGVSRAELIKLIHRPGWTTPAEFVLVASQVQAIIDSALALQKMHAGLLEGSRAVGR